jgi:uncharacterized protein DUF4124
MRFASRRWHRCRRAAVALACAAAGVLVASSPAQATVYKCSSGNGVVVYQEFPCPIGRELRNFDDDPPDLSVIHGGVATPSAPAEKPKDTRTIQGDVTIGKVVGDATARRFVHKGMSEAEVLAKIGRPDATAGGSRTQQTRWSYLPADGDPDTVTTITFSAGAVSDVSRKVIKK